MKRICLRVSVVALLVITLAACLETAPANNRAPLADAGSNQTVTVGETVTVSGSSSSDPDGDTLTYNWMFEAKPAGSQAELEQAGSAEASFVVDAEGSYQLTLSVADGGTNATDTVTINAQPKASSDATLEPDKTYTSPDGVVLGALDNTLSEALGVSVRQTAMPETPLPKTTTPVADFYHLSAARDTFAAGEPFLIALPVPEGTSTNSLALALLLQPEDVDNDGLSRPIWHLLEGVYDPENNYFVTTLPRLVAEGRIVVLVDAREFESPSLNPASALTTQQTTGEFEVKCRSFNDNDVNNRNISCAASDESDLETALEDALADYTGLGFADPYLQRRIDENASSFNPNNPNIVFGEYLAELRPFRNVDSGDDRWPCGNDGSVTNLGGYSSGAKSFFVCIDNGGVTTRAEETARHEYFHATQYGYTTVRNNKQTWVLEGTAVASEGSLATMIRDDSRGIRRVDEPLTATQTARNPDSTIEYRTQDFFVYTGLDLGRGLDYLIEVFTRGATTSDVDGALTALSGNDGLGEYYWKWAKNQSFEKTIDIGNTVLGSPCTFSSRSATPISIDYNHIAPPNNRSITLSPLTSKVVQLDLTALPDADYSTQISVAALGANTDDIKMKFYDAADAGSTACQNSADTMQLNVTVSAGQSRTFYALISNIALSTNASARLEFASASPTLNILSPTANASFTEGNSIDFLATATGFQGSNPAATIITWTYLDYDGVPFTFTSDSGETVTRSFCDGNYTVTAKAVDASSSQEATETVTFTVSNASPPPPECAPSIDIISPADGATFALGSTITFEAIIDDDKPGTDDPIYPVIWRDGGPDGTIIQQADILVFSSSKFGIGSHDIYVKYGSASDQITIEIVDTTNSPPSANITPPEADLYFFWDDYDQNQGTVIPFSGSGQDAEDGTLSGNALRWSYRQAGSSSWTEFGTGTSVNFIQRLKSNQVSYDIRLVTTDSEGLSDTEIIKITIQGPPS